MRFTDTHSHLYDEQLLPDRAEAISRALQAGVTQIYMPNCDSHTIAPMLEVADLWKDHCFPMMGLHPVYVKQDYKEELATVSEWLERRKFYAIGEIGIDKHWDLSFLDQQREAFAAQIDLALTHDLPIVIHSREATRDCIDIVRGKQTGALRGIFHCFSGNIDEAQEITGLGLMLGIGGVVTFKNSGLPQVLSGISLDHIVLETDAPYLAPVPYRGKRNESSYIPLIAQKIAEITGMSVAEIAGITNRNAEKVFGKRMI